MAGQERPHLASHLFVVRGDAVDQRAPLVGRRGQRLVEELADRLPPLRSHASPRDSSRWSQASASRCSRPIVPTETFSARAVSSTLSPPKNRSSMTLHLRASTAASAVSASSSATMSSHFIGAKVDDLVERRRRLTAAALLAAVTTGVVDEDLAHEMGGDAEEMRAGFPVGHCLRNQAQIRLVHERGWLKRGGRVLVAQVVRGQAAKLVVDDGHQPIDRRGIAVLEIEQQPRDLGRRVHLSLLVRVVRERSLARQAAIPAVPEPYAGNRFFGDLAPVGTTARP